MATKDNALEVAAPAVAPVFYKAATIPTELQNPNDIVGFGTLDADAREKLAVTETPFIVTGAEQIAFPSGDMGVRYELIVAPDDEHDSPWESAVVLGLPKNPDPEKPTDRERLLEYFQHGGTRPVGWLIAVMVPTKQPQPYFAMRPAPARVMARFALVDGMS